MLNKIFQKSTKKKGAIPTSLVETNGLCTYSFSVVWTNNGSSLSLYSLNAKLSSSGNWVKLISIVITDDDGEITIQIGNFAKGTSIDMLFGVYPMQDIPEAAIYVTNMTEGTSQQTAPANGTQKLTKATAWNGQFTIILF